MADNPLLSNLVAAWGGDESAIPEHEVEPFPDETDSPVVNELIRLARYYMAGLCQPYEFVSGMQKMTDALRDCLQQHRELSKLLTLTEEQQELSKGVESAYYNFLEALAEMVASFTKEDLPRVEAGIEMCKQSVGTLQSWYFVLSQLQRREFGVVCSHCGHYAPAPMQAHCAGCQEPLPSVDEPYSPEDDWVVVPTAYSTIYEGLLASASSNAPSGEWLGRVDAVRQGFLRLKQTLGDVTVWEDEILELQPALTDEVDALLGLTEDTLESLQTLQTYAPGCDLEEIDKAWYRLIDVLPGITENALEMRRSLWGLIEYLSSDEYRAELEAASEQFEGV